MPTQNPNSLPMVPLNEPAAWMLPVEAAATRFFPLQIQLKIHSETTLPPHHAGLISGLLKSSLQTDSLEGILIDYPEQCRTLIRTGEFYNFGVTLLESTSEAARRSLLMLNTALNRTGQNSPPVRHGLRGNFSIHQITSLVDPAASSESPAYIPSEWLQSQIDEVRRQKEIRLRFRTPLHCKRPVNLRGDSVCLDRELFLPDVFLRRAAKRCSDLGLLKAIPDIRPTHVELIENRIIWLDLKYGSENTPLSGAVGCIVLKLNEPDLAEIVVRAQYARLGEKTRFGFGAFEILDLPPSIMNATSRTAVRSSSLLDLAMTSVHCREVADDYELETGRLSFLTRAVRSGRYKPQQITRVILAADSKEKDPRLLSIPHAEDRALQACVLKQISDAMDGFFEESSHAYRRKLGRHTAAKRLQSAYRDGYHWAVRSDFHRFFDSVDHATLQDKLDAYLNDDRLSGIIMLWVRSASPWPGRGLPTGSPLSPVLANLFLDRFDEEVAAEGGRLVRYADDFLILFRKPEDAESLFRQAEESARSLKLHLNDDKTKFLDLRQPFDFLGYRFHKIDDWEVVDGQPPRHVDDLGWEDAPKAAASVPVLPALPGETETTASASSGMVIAGPDVSWVGIEKDKFVVRYRDRSQPESIVPLQRVEDLVLIGRPILGDSLWKKRRTELPTLWLTDATGRIESIVMPPETQENALLLIAQVQAATNAGISLAIARKLVAAKLSNYADLAIAVPMRGRDSGVSLQLRQFASNATDATTMEQLLGIEGAGAAAWYRTLNQRLDSKFRFQKRVAPSAEDPVNVLLNLGYTWLYRMSQLMLIREGLSPTIGFLHQPRAGHAALASDIMEPMRHLVDRVVIMSTFAFSQNDFTKKKEGPFRLQISPHAVRSFLKMLHTTFTQSCVGVDQTEARPYRQQIGTMTRSLHRHLLTPEKEFRPFRHSPP